MFGLKAVSKRWRASLWWNWKCKMMTIRCGFWRWWGLKENDRWRYSVDCRYRVDKDTGGGYNKYWSNSNVVRLILSTFGPIISFQQSSTIKQPSWVGAILRGHMVAWICSPNWTEGGEASSRSQRGWALVKKSNWATTFGLSFGICQNWLQLKPTMIGRYNQYFDQTLWEWLHHHPSGTIGPRDCSRGRWSNTASEPGHQVETESLWVDTSPDLGRKMEAIRERSATEKHSNEGLIHYQ